MKLFSRSNHKSQDQQSVIVVSGLPRSGTSMMMRMLAEGGLSILTDEQRHADDDNPNGYFELEVVKQLKDHDSAWLKEADGKVVKVISSLLEYLPDQYHYKIIFMERDFRETLDSQKKMLNHRGQEARLTDDEMQRQFQAHLSVMKPWLVRQPNIEVLYVNYNALMTAPGPFCEKITQFLGLPLNQAQMLAVPDQQLYRNRSRSDK